MAVVVVFGACGCGKTTVGRALADKFGCAFADADDCHPPSNVDKMSRGIPLTDEDRLPWLNTLHDVISSWSDDPSPRARPQPHGESSSASEGLIGVLACSALKRVYRDILSGHHSALLQGSGGVAPNQASVVTSCVFVLLKASEEVLTQRLMARRGHFMPASLVRSQLDILELPNDQERAVVIETDGLGIDDILTRIIDKLKHRNIE